MYLINEENDIRVALGILDDFFQSAFKFAGSTGACEHGRQVQSEYLYAFEILRHVTTNQSECQTFNHGGFTGTWSSYQNRIVLGLA